MIRTVKIQGKQWLSQSTFSMSLYVPDINPLPGQFFQVRVGDGLDPFLNRPISVASYYKKRLLLIVKVVGQGTHMLSKKREGDMLTLLGPFGKGIYLNRQRSLLIAGGIGVAPIFFVAQKLHRQRTPFAIVYGAKTGNDLILKGSIVKLAHEAMFVTERGSKKRMTAVEALRDIDTSEYKVAYACGPKAMLLDLQKLDLPIPVHAFCEDFLGCGCGLCLGCAILYNGEYKRICDDGPVFELKGIKFNQWISDCQ